jgi:hypothetical protein
MNVTAGHQVRIFFVFIDGVMLAQSLGESEAWFLRGRSLSGHWCLDVGIVADHVAARVGV